ncbi:hypothetical protein Tco_0673472, partial [Tanacetum coccineum]
GSSQNNDVSSITSNGADPKRSVDGPTLKNDLECHLLQNGLETTGGASGNLSLLSSIASILVVIHTVQRPDSASLGAA